MFSQGMIQSSWKQCLQGSCTTSEPASYSSWHTVQASPALHAARVGWAARQTKPNTYYSLSAALGIVGSLPVRRTMASESTLSHTFSALLLPSVPNAGPARAAAAAAACVGTCGNKVAQHIAHISCDNKNWHSKRGSL